MRWLRMFGLAVVGLSVWTSSFAAADELQRGVRAEYVITLHFPQENHTTVVFAEYLVTTDRWLLVSTSISPDWIGVRYYPLLGGSRFLSIRDVGTTLWSRSFDVPEEFGVSDLPRLCTPSNREWLRSIHFADLRSRAWSLPEFTAKWISETHAPSATSLEYSGDLADREILFSVKAEKVTQSTCTVRQTVVQGIGEGRAEHWNSLRLNRNCTPPRWLPEVCVRRGGHARYTEWNSDLQYPTRPQPPRTLDQEVVDSQTLLFAVGAGGRHARLAWTSLAEGTIPIPEEVVVSLGDSGRGMFLRSSRLISAEVLNPNEVDELVRERTLKPDQTISRLTAQVADTVWGRDLRAVNQSSRASFDQLSRDLERTAADSTLSAGDRLKAKCQLCMLAISSDTSESLTRVRESLLSYFDELERIAGREAVPASLFNLQQCIFVWKRSDLIELTWQIAYDHLATWPPNEQIRILNSAEQGHAGDGLHAVLLARAIEASVEAEVDHDLVKSAILRAWMVYSRSQGNSPVHFFSKNPMPEHLDFLNQFRKALVRAENSSSPAIQTIASALLDRNW